MVRLRSQHGGWFRHCATSRKAAVSIPDGVTGIFNELIFRPHYAPGIDSASNRKKKYLGYLLEGVKVAGG